MRDAGISLPKNSRQFVKKQVLHRNWECGKRGIMPETCYHPSIEGAQHGAKSLTQFLDYAKASRRGRRATLQLHVGEGRSGLNPRRRSRRRSPRAGWRWTASRRIARFGFTPPPGPTARRCARFCRRTWRSKSAAEIEKWSEDYLLRLLDLARRAGREDHCRCSGAWLLAGNWRPAIRGDFGRAAITTCCERARNGLSRKRRNSAPTPTSWAFISRTKSIPAPPRCARTISTCWCRFATGTNAWRSTPTRRTAGRGRTGRRGFSRSPRAFTPVTSRISSSAAVCRCA